MNESQFFQHWQDVPQDLWRWGFFTPQEIASKGNGSILVHFESLDKLQAARIKANRPFIIDSGYRDPDYNSRIGGAKDSMHKQGRAFDVRLKGFDKAELHNILLSVGFTGFGLHYATFIHADTGPKRTW